jgi:hypothetical protein
MLHSEGAHACPETEGYRPVPDAVVVSAARTAIGTAFKGVDNGSFVDEIFPLGVTRRDGTTTTFAVDHRPTTANNPEGA